jgi:hypothetical protein
MAHQFRAAAIVWRHGPVFSSSQSSFSLIKYLCHYRQIAPVDGSYRWLRFDARVPAARLSEAERTAALSKAMIVD